MSNIHTVTTYVKVIDSDKANYIKYSFYAKTATTNVDPYYTIDSNVLSGSSNSDYILMSYTPSSYDDNGYVTASTGPLFTLDISTISSALLELMGDDSNFDSNNECKVDFTCLLTTHAYQTNYPSQRYRGDKAYTLRDWDADLKVFKEALNMGSTFALIFKDLTIKRTYALYNEDPGEGSITMNTVTVTADEYPDYSNFESCWTFDKDKNAIEGVFYVAK